MADIVEKSSEEAQKEVAVEKPVESTEQSKSAAEKDDKKEDTVRDDVETNVTANDDDDVKTSKLERRIIRQVEYYFGDANLNRDKFLVEQISKNEEGWVQFAVLQTFRRLSELSNDTEVIVNALLKSDEGLVEINEDHTKLRRHPERPIPEHNEERRKDIMSRTAYAKGFSLDADIAELIEFFAPFDKVLNINMRKYLDKPTKTYKFKGSVFVTFEKKDQAQSFIEKEKVMFKERELLRKWQEKYLEEKKEEQKSKSKKSKAKKEDEHKFELPKGTVLFFDGTTDIVTREMIRETIEKIVGEWEIAYIDFNKGNKDGYLRFQEENNAVKFMNSLEEKKLQLNDDVSLPLRLLTEDEEKTYLDKAVEQMKNRRNHHHHNKFKGGNRKRRNDNDNRREEKKQKTAAVGGDD